MDSLQIIGVGLNLVVATGAAISVAAAAKRGDRTGLSWWLFVSAGFLSFATMRATDAEDWLRGWLRAIAQEGAFYAERWMIQTVLVIIALLAIVMIAVLLFRLWRRAAGNPPLRSAILAGAATIALATLYILRIISLHAVDRLLYAGPLKLNWLLEGGACVMALLAAGMFLARRDVRG